MENQIGQYFDKYSQRANLSELCKKKKKSKFQADSNSLINS